MREFREEIVFMLFFQQSHWNGLENLREQRRRKLMKLIVKASKGDEKAKKAIRKYDEEEKILREKATETGYYWV